MNQHAHSREPSQTALLGLKALAPIVIFTGHWTEGLFDNPLHQGQLSIDFFFAVEGFFATGVVLNARAGTRSWELFRKQLTKVYPLYILGMLMSVALAAFLARFSVFEWPVDVIHQAVTWNTFFIPVFNDPVFVFPLNPPTWAIALEVYAFALLCVMRRWQRLSVLMPFVLAAAGLCLLVSYLARDANMGFAPRSYWGGLPRCLFGFFYGGLLYHLIRRYGRVLPSLNPLLVWGAFLGIMFLSVRYISLPLLLFAMPLIVWLGAVATNPIWLRGVAQQGGRISYGLYLLGYPLLIGFKHLVAMLGTPQTVLGLAIYYLVVLATVSVAAYGATRLVEFAFQKKLRVAPGPVLLGRSE